MPAGRPNKFKSVKELQEKIDKYFEECWEGEGKDKKLIRPYTITGLALALDTCRDTLLEYQKNENLNEFSDTIKKAKDKCHNFAEEQLFVGKNVAGVIFNLKNNFGHVDKTEVKTDNTTTITHGLTPEVLEKIDEIAKNQ